MYIDKIIKKEVTTLIISVGLLLIVFIGVSFASFFKVDEGSDNIVQTGDLAISFCSDSACDSTYENIGQVIGTSKIDGSSVPTAIYPYPSDGTYSNATPYIFKVENTGDMDAHVTIKLKEDTDFLPTGNYKEYTRLTNLYSEHLKIAVRKKVLAEGSEYQMGDVNMDGIVNKEDYSLILNAAAGRVTLTEEQTKLADVNEDGTINSSDALRLDRIIRGDNVASLEKTYINSFSELTNSVIYTGDVIKAGESATYFLWLYLDDTTPNQAQKTYFVGNLDIQAEYMPEGVFANDPWETIIANIRNDKIESYKVGDTKEVDMGTFGKYTLRIANKTSSSGCSSTTSTNLTSQTSCGFVLEFVDVIATHEMNSTATNSGGWPSTTMREYLNDTIYNYFPNVLKNAIIDTKVNSGAGLNDSVGHITSTDKLYLLSPTEVWGDLSGWSSVSASDGAKNFTKQLDYYSKIGVTTSNYSGAIKKQNGKAMWWYLRTANKTGDTYFYGVNSNGNWSNSNANDVRGVSPAFRIG